MKQNFLKRQTFIYDEKSKKHLPVVDMRKNFKKTNKSASHFIESRISKVRELRKRNKRLPIPGGVGYGVYYKPDFQFSFSTFTSLDFCILFQQNAGGQNSQPLYLTATNASAKGVEALICFTGQSSPSLKIFDWSLPFEDKWVFSAGCNAIPQNIDVMNLGGMNFSFCRVVNETRMISATEWCNSVYLQNFPNNQWDLIYRNNYNATLANQKDSHFGSWGPIVETFQTDLGDLNPMGFANSLLYNDRNKPLLTSVNSIVKDDADDVNPIYKTSGVNGTFIIT